MADRAENTLLYLFVMLGGIVAVQWLRNRSTTAPGSFAPTAPQTPGSLPGAAQGALDIIAPMHVSPPGQAFIKNNEQLRLNRYPDAGGFSIGWGHKIQPGENIGQSITRAQAQALFDDDIATVEQTINGAVTVQLSQNQFDALADFVFNVGAHAFQTSTLLHMLNNGNYAGAAGQFQRWIYSSGQVNANLQQRRQREANLFNSGAVTS